jgi:hypothetical protein
MIAGGPLGAVSPIMLLSTTSRRSARLRRAVRQAHRPERSRRAVERSVEPLNVHLMQGLLHEQDIGCSTLDEFGAMAEVGA